MSREKIVESILTIAAGLLILHLVFDIHALVVITAVLLVISLVSRKIAGAIVWFWVKFAEVLGFISGKVILGIVFYCFLFPIALLYRLFNKDPLLLKRKKGSYYTIRNHRYKSEDLKKPW